MELSAMFLISFLTRYSTMGVMISTVSGRKISELTDFGELWSVWQFPVWSVKKMCGLSCDMIFLESVVPSKSHTFESFLNIRLSFVLEAIYWSIAIHVFLTGIVCMIPALVKTRFLTPELTRWKSCTSSIKECYWRECKQWLLILLLVYLFRAINIFFIFFSISLFIFICLYNGSQLLSFWYVHYQFEKSVKVRRCF